MIFSLMSTFSICDVKAVPAIRNSKSRKISSATGQDISTFTDFLPCLRSIFPLRTLLLRSLSRSVFPPGVCDMQSVKVPPVSIQICQVDDEGVGTAWTLYHCAGIDSTTVFFAILIPTAWLNC